MGEGSFWPGKLLRKEAIPYYLIITLYLLIVVPLPGAAWPFAGHDDGLFFRWSLSILKGKWLGPWDSLTTSKGALHSVLTSTASVFGINPFAYKRLFYLLASLVFVLLGLKRAPQWLRLLTLVALLTDPWQYSLVSLRNLREGTYIPLQLLGISFGIFSLDRAIKKERFDKYPALAIFLMSLSFGLAFITREGRIIVLSALISWLILFITSRPVFRSFVSAQQPARSSLVAILCALLLFGSVTPTIVIRLINFTYYGQPISNSVEEGSFPKLYQAIAGFTIEGYPNIPRVPIRKAVMQQVIEDYGNSNNSLATILSRIDPGWERHGCSIYPETCGEIAGGWFQWALRDAIASVVSESGDNSERSFQEITTKALSDAKDICRNTNLLRCNDDFIAYMPKPTRWGFSNNISALVAEAKKIIIGALAPNPYPEGRVSIESELVRGIDSPSQGLAFSKLVSLGLHALDKSHIAMWKDKFISIANLGALLKCILLVATAFSIGYAIYCHTLIFIDCRPIAWLAFILFAHLIVYTLISLTSFPALGYTSMCSAIFITLQSRIIALSLDSSSWRRQRIPGSTTAP